MLKECVKTTEKHGSDMIMQFASNSTPVVIRSSPNGRFMQMNEKGSVGCSKNIEAECTWVIVEAGYGKYALYNINSKRFLRIKGNEVNGNGGKVLDKVLPDGFDSERFTVVNVGNGTVAFHNAIHNRFIRMKDNKVDAGGGKKNVDKLPREWKSEQWEIVPHHVHKSRRHPDAAVINRHPEAAAVVAASSGAVLAGSVPLVAIGCVQAAGFSSGGIIAGSAAAAMMSAEAIAAGGSIAAGGTVATLQSVGAVGFGSGAAIGGIVAVTVGGAALLSYGIYRCVDSFVTAPELSAAPKKQSFPFRKVSIKAPNERFLIVLGGGRGNWFFNMMAGPCYTGVVKAEAKHASWWEMLTVLPREGDPEYFALQSHHGAILRVSKKGRDVRADSCPSKGQTLDEQTWFRFLEISSGDNGAVKGHFQAWDGSYLTINHKHQHFIANAKEKNEAAIFEVWAK